MKTAYENLSNNSLIATLVERDFSILTLQQELAQMKRMIFGAKSERFIPLAVSYTHLDVYKRQVEK